MKPSFTQKRAASRNGMSRSGFTSAGERSSLIPGGCPSGWGFAVAVALRGCGFFDLLVSVGGRIEVVPVRKADARAGPCHLRNAVFPRSLGLPACDQKVAAAEHEGPRSAS